MPHYRNADQWHALFEQQKNSGLGIAAFCQQKNLTTSNFYTWRKKLKGALEPSDSGSNDWQPIEPAAASANSGVAVNSVWDLELTLPGGAVLRLRH